MAHSLLAQVNICYATIFSDRLTLAKLYNSGLIEKRNFIKMSAGQAHFPNK